MGYYYVKYYKIGEDKPIFTAFGTEKDSIWEMDDIKHGGKEILSEKDKQYSNYEEIKKYGKVVLKEGEGLPYQKEVMYVGESLDEILNGNFDEKIKKMAKEYYLYFAKD